MEEFVTQINGRIMVNVDLSVKNTIYVKKIMSGILLHVIVKMKNILQVLGWLRKFVWGNYRAIRKTKSEGLQGRNKFSFIYIYY